MRPNYTKIFFILALFAFAARLLLAPYLTYYLDLDTFRSWSYYLAEHGFQSFYANVWSDYLPGYHYILWLLGIIRLWFIEQSLPLNEVILYKMPSMIADIGNALFIYLIAKKFTTPLKSLLSAAFFLISPAVLANSTFWGQADSFTTFFLLSSFYFLLQSKLWFSAMLIGLGTVVKPIAVLSIPIYLTFILFRFKDRGLSSVALFLLISSSIAVLTFLPFSNSPDLIQFIFQRFQQTFHQYTYTSLNAFNIWAIVSDFWVPDNLTFLNISLQNWGTIFLGIVYVPLLIILLFRLRSVQHPAPLLSFVLTIGYLAMFLLLTRIHERHLFFSLSLMALLLPNASILGIMVIFAAHIVYTLNLAFAYFQLIGKPLPWDHTIIVLLSLINMGALIYLLQNFLHKYAKSR